MVPICVEFEQLALRIGLERAVAGIGGRTVRHLHLEKTVAVDRHVLRVAGLLQVALRVQTFGRDLLHAGAELDARGHLGLLGRVGARLTHGLIKQIFEHGARALEAIGADVGEVVRDHVHLGLLRIHAGRSDIK
jgi:hypothetical protein